MKLSPPRVVHTTASAAQHDNAKRTMVASVQYKMRGSIIIGRHYVLDVAAWMAHCLNVAGEKQSHVIKG